MLMKWAAKAWSWLKPRVIPAFTVVVGVTMLMWVVLRADDQTPPSTQEYGLVVFFSSALNILGGYGFSKIGRANPSHARSAVRRLTSIGQNITEARRALTADEGTPGIGADAADALLGATMPHLKNAIEDWNEVHREALQEVMTAWKQGDPNASN